MDLKINHTEAWSIDLPPDLHFDVHDVGEYRLKPYSMRVTSLRVNLDHNPYIGPKPLVSVTLRGPKLLKSGKPGGRHGYGFATRGGKLAAQVPEPIREMLAAVAVPGVWGEQ